MGTHISIFEFIVISIGSIFSYVFVKAFYETYIKNSK